MYSGDRKLASDDIIWKTDYLKLLKQYNQLPIALRKQIWENIEDMKELVKMFQDYKEPIPCIEEITICENSGFNEEMEGKTNLKFKEEIKDIREEQVTILEENSKGKEEYLNMVEEKVILGRMNKKLLQQNKEVGYRKNRRDWEKKIIKKKTGTGKENARKGKIVRRNVRKNKTKKIEKIVVRK